MRRIRIRRRPCLTATLLMVALGVGGCTDEQRFAPACPALAMLPDAADLTRYSAPSQDITDLVVDARITGIPAQCRQDEPGHVNASIKVVMAAQCGPAATASKIELPYFVAVMDGDRIVDRQDYSVVANFPSNTNVALPTGEQIDLVVPVTKEKSAAAYSIFVGYVLTPEQLALNRKRGPR